MLSDLLRLLPEKYKTQQFYEKLFNYYKDNDRRVCVSVYKDFIPKEFITHQMTLDALDVYIYMGVNLELEDIPKEFMTFETVCIYLKHHSRVELLEGILKDVVKEYDEWLQLSKINPLIIKYVPENMKTPEMFLEMVRSYGRYGLEYIPENMKTPEICMEAVKRDGLALQYVPENMRTPEMCMEAVNKYPIYFEYFGGSLSEMPTALQYVPENMRTPEICMEAVKQDLNALKYIPENLKTEELYLNLAKSQPGYVTEYKDKTTKIYISSVLGLIPENMRTFEICLKEVKNNTFALRYVPENMKTYELYLNLAKGTDLFFFPENMRTPEICIEALKNNRRALQYLPESMRTPEICMEAVKNNGYSLQYVPESMKTLEICMEAVKSCRDAIEYVPDEFKTDEFYIQLLNDGVDLNIGKHIPREILTQEMCLLISKKPHSCMNWLYIPRIYKNEDLAINHFLSLGIITKEETISNNQEIENLKQMKKMLFKEVSDIAAEWWLSQLQIDELEKVSRAGLQDPTEVALLALSNMVKRENISREQAEKFKLILSDKIIHELEKKGEINFGCDYHPQGILAEAALEAGIKTNFPYKTHMCVKPETIEIYGMGSRIILWSKETKTKTSIVDVPDGWSLYVDGENITPGKSKK